MENFVFSVLYDVQSTTENKFRFMTYSQKTPYFK